MMKAQLEYKTYTHIIDLSKVRNYQQLIIMTKQLLQTISSHFQLRIGSSDGPVLDGAGLTYIKKVGFDLIKLIIVEDNLSGAQVDKNSNLKARCHSLSNGKGQKEQLSCKQLSEHINSLNSMGLEKRVKDKRLECSTSKIQEISQHQLHLDYSEKLGQVQPPKQHQTQIVVGNHQCDRCFIFPILGPIYKCLVCPNFDLCQSCQHRYHNFHPLLEITSPSQYPAEVTIIFSEQSQAYMQKRLQQQHAKIKQQKMQVYRCQATRKQEIDPSLLEKKEVRQPNFLASILGVSKYSQ